MKYLLFFICLNVHAENWAAAAKVGGATVGYTDRATCESKEGQPCFEYSQCHLDECSVQGGELKQDAAKVAAKNALKADAALRETKKAGLLAVLAACVKSGVMTPACTAAQAKLLTFDQLSTGDL